MATSVSTEGEAAERARLELWVYEACTRSVEGADFLVSAFVQSLCSYRRPSVCTPFPSTLFTMVGDFKDKDFSAAAAAVQSFPALLQIVYGRRPVGLITVPVDSSVCDSSSALSKSALHTGAANGDTAAVLAPKALKALGVVVAYSEDEINGAAHSANGTLWADASLGHATSVGISSLVSTSSACNPNPVETMPLRALKLLHWILRFHHHVKFVPDLAELSDVSALGGFRGASSRRHMGFDMGSRPNYVLKIQDTWGSGTAKGVSVFEAVKSQFGSILAFHGTSAENLHSILRCGLLNMSKTELQRNGAVFGEGVYLSTDPAVAHSFCKAGDGWEHSLFGPRVQYLLVCEVAKGEGVSSVNQNLTSLSSSSECVDEKNFSVSSVRGKRPSSVKGMPHAYILVQNSDLVKIRFIFVYREPSRTRQKRGGLPGELQNMVTAGAQGPRSLQAAEVHNFRISERIKRVDWCKSFIVVYIALLFGIGFLKSDVVKYGRLSTFLNSFWPFSQ